MINNDLIFKAIDKLTGLLNTDMDGFVYGDTNEICDIWRGNSSLAFGMS